MDSTTFKKVKDLVQEALATAPPVAGIAFGPIIVRRAYDADDGSTYLRILIVIDGPKDDLDIKWLGSLPRHLLSKLSAAGIDDYPNLSYVSKDDWGRGSEEWLRTYPEALVDPR